MKLVSINPSKNYELLGEVAETTEQEVLEKLKLARSVQKEWRDLGLPRRIEIMQDLCTSFEDNLEKIARLTSLEMGKPIVDSREDVTSGLEYLRSYLDSAEKALEAEITFESDEEIHKVFYEPKGVVASIIPWNFPFSNLIWQSCQNLIVRQYCFK